MEINEARKVVASLMAAYPNYRPIDTSLAAEMWKDVTEGYSYSQISIALKAYMRSDTKGFAPAPGQVIEKIQMMTQADMPNEMEAWGLVRAAISNSAYWASEEFAKLPTIVQKAVGVPDQLRILAMDEDYSESVTCSHFIKCYKNVAQRQKEIDRMQPEARRLIEDTSKGSYAAQIERKRQKAIESASERKQGEIRELERVTGHNGIPDRLKDAYNAIMEEES